MKEVHAGKRLVFIIVTSVLLVSWIPLASELGKLFLLLLAMVVYVYMFFSIGKLISEYKSYPKTDNALVQLYLNILLTFSSAYFFLSAIDIDENMITGLRAMSPHFSEDYSFIGVIDYFNGLGFTFVNCIYYSLVVMATLGDSSIVLKDTLPRTIVMFQVGYTIWLTGYALANHFNNKSTEELKKVENNLKSEISHIRTVNNQDISTDNRFSFREFANKAKQWFRNALG